MIESNDVEFQLIRRYLLKFNQMQTKNIFFNLERVSTFSAARHVLEKINIDIIILCVDYHILEGKIYKTMNSMAPYLPFIIISYADNEESIAQAIKGGAQDYLIKDKFDENILSHVMLCAMERKKIDNLLNEYALIVECSNEAIISINLDGMITSWNYAAEKMLGYKTKDAMNENVFKLLSKDIMYDIDKIKTIGRKYKPALKRELMVTCKNLENKNILISISPIREKQKQLIGCSIIIHDIDQFTAEKNQLAIQYKIATLLAESNDLFSASYGILEGICNLLNCQVGEIWVVDQDKKKLKRVSAWANTEYYSSLINKILEKQYNLGEGLHGRIWKTKSFYCMTHLMGHTAKKYLSDYKCLNLQSCFGFPITFQEEVIGVVVFFCQSIGKPDSNFLLMTPAIGSQIGTFIKRKRMENDLIFLAKHDALTGLSNRSDFEDNLNRALIHAKRYHCLIALLYLDLDYFKKINDTLGHEKGDLLLLEVARRLRKIVRNTDTLARLGGDEFVILLSQVTSTENVAIIVRKIINAFSKPCLLDGLEYNTSVSIGISMYPRDGVDARSLLKNADMAMYLSKAKGRNNFQFCPPAMIASAERRVKILEDLQYALSRKEFVLYYQPLIDIRTNKVIAFEALIRWNHPSGNTLLPSEFISIAEQNGLIQHIGEWVIYTACLQTKKLHEAGFELMQISINISVLQLTRNFLNIINDIFKKVDLDPKYLIIELTETGLMENSENNIYLLRGLRELGVKISIDDFGTGYSSLSYLTKFTINSIKIDRTFVSVLMKDTSSSIIVGAIIAMAHSLNMRVVAEGVETQEQMSMLKEKDCDEYQGEFCSYPLLPDQLIDFLKNFSLQTV
jgi:diguanylate cyclase (GGDEF)-like protein/PAS domain S-box-containing protein